MPGKSGSRERLREKNISTFMDGGSLSLCPQVSTAMVLLLLVLTYDPTVSLLSFSARERPSVLQFR